MSDQTPKALRQSLLEQINADKKAVEALSDEELEEVAGGMMETTVYLRPYRPFPEVGMNTGQVVKPVFRQQNTGVRNQKPFERIQPAIE